MAESTRAEIRKMRLIKIRQILCSSKDSNELLYAIGLGILELIESQE